MIYAIAGAIVVFIAVYLYLVFPAKLEEDRRKPYQNKYFAHRGLFQNEGELPPENTAEAFDAACRAGFGSELDVQFTADDQLIVFHDNDYKRAVGVDKNVWDVTLEEARQYKLFSRDYQIPLFSEVLETVNGRTPLIIEIKAEGRNKKVYHRLCQRVEEALRDYKGEYCIESFHPSVVEWWHDNRPDVIRGQLLTNSYEGMPESVQFLLRNNLVSYIGRPHFIAYNHTRRPVLLAVVKKLGGMLVMWTVKNERDGLRLEKNNDTQIFDSYMPAGPDYYGETKSE